MGSQRAETRNDAAYGQNQPATRQTSFGVLAVLRMLPFSATNMLPGISFRESLFGAHAGWHKRANFWDTLF